MIVGVERDTQRGECGAAGREAFACFFHVSASGHYPRPVEVAPGSEVSVLVVLGGVAFAEPRRGSLDVPEMELHPAEVVQLHGDPPGVPESAIELEALGVELARACIVAAESDARGE